jgi:hypothetical protein
MGTGMIALLIGAVGVIIGGLMVAVFYYRSKASKMQAVAVSARKETATVMRECKEDEAVMDLAQECRKEIYVDLVTSLLPTLKRDLSIRPILGGDSQETVKTVTFRCEYRGREIAPDELKRHVRDKVVEFIDHHPKPVFRIKFEWTFPEEERR